MSRGELITMDAKTVLIRSCAIIAGNGYVTKSAALINNTMSTVDMVAQSIMLSKVTPTEVQQYGELADSIIDWITGYDGRDSYMLACKHALASVQTSPYKTLGLICSLPDAYAKHIASLRGLSHITAPNDYVAPVGTRIYKRECVVINVQTVMRYHKVSLVDSATGCLMTHMVSRNNRSKLTLPRIGTKMAITATVYKNRPCNPSETVLSGVIYER